MQGLLGLAARLLAWAGLAWLGLAWRRLAWHFACPRAWPGLAWPSLAELQGIAAETSNPTCNPSIFKGKVLIFFIFPLTIEGLQVGLLVSAAIPRSSARLGQAGPGQARPGQARPDDARRGQARQGQPRPAGAPPARATLAKLRKHRSGQARLGQAAPQARPGRNDRRRQRRPDQALAKNEPTTSPSMRGE